MRFSLIISSVLLLAANTVYALPRGVDERGIAAPLDQAPAADAAPHTSVPLTARGGGKAKDSKKTSNDKLKEGTEVVKKMSEMFAAQKKGPNEDLSGS